MIFLGFPGYPGFPGFVGTLCRKIPENSKFLLENKKKTGKNPPGKQENLWETGKNRKTGPVGTLGVQAKCLQLYLKRDSGAGVFLWILRNS